MNERKDFLFTLRNLVTQIDGLAEIYKQQFDFDYFDKLGERINKVYSDIKTKLESSGFAISKTESELWTDFEYSVIQCFMKISNADNEVKCDSVNNFLSMFFYSKIGNNARNEEEKENLEKGRYKDLLSNHDYKKLYTEIDTLITRQNNLIRLVFVEYPQFEQDLPILIENKIISEIENGLKWELSKTSLAEYFDWVKNKTDWKSVEKLFCEKDLKNCLTSKKV